MDDADPGKVKRGMGRDFMRTRRWKYKRKDEKL